MSRTTSSTADGGAGERQRGRRPGAPDTRGRILEVARESFAERGFRATTIRGVAAAAGVDAALVHHYFGTKDDLFLAALRVPVDPRAVLPTVFEQGTDGAAARLLTAVLGVWDQPEGRLQLVSVLRASLGDAGSSLLQDGFLRLVEQGLAGVLPGPDPRLRAQLVATQMLGLLLARYVLVLEPLASLPRSAVVELVAPNLQRYLDGPLDQRG
ncbi:TetR family transcriptional regulator [Nocardioides caldifontis]|uniref:TetR/AcrR family transcriptional regulator n=1 Tax=Nocardioides caldifontis TaxID=2588938 RepID=UPI0011E00BE4|nr:TetR family transcriptional regulator [Nocardioides caldifontis]